MYPLFYIFTNPMENKKKALEQFILLIIVVIVLAVLIVKFCLNFSK